MNSFFLPLQSKEISISELKYFHFGKYFHVNRHPFKHKAVLTKIDVTRELRI